MRTRRSGVETCERVFRLGMVVFMGALTGPPNKRSFHLLNRAGPHNFGQCNFKSAWALGLPSFLSRNPFSTKCNPAPAF